MKKVCVCFVGTLLYIYASTSFAMDLIEIASVKKGNCTEDVGLTWLRGSDQLALGKKSQDYIKRKYAKSGVSLQITRIVNRDERLRSVQFIKANNTSQECATNLYAVGFGEDDRRALADALSNAEKRHPGYDPATMQFKPWLPTRLD